MKEYGTKVVGWHESPVPAAPRSTVPRCSTSVAQAVDATGANASIVFVPAPAAMDALLEAIDAQIHLVIAITEGNPDRRHAHGRCGARDRARPLVGPNGPGRDHAGQSKIAS